MAKNVVFKIIADTEDFQKELARNIQLEKELNSVLDKQIKTQKDAEAQNKILRQLRKEANTETEQGRRVIEKANATIDRNTEYIRKNADTMKKQQMDIGNYKKVWEGLGAAWIKAGLVISGLTATFGTLIKSNAMFEQSMKTLQSVIDATDEDMKLLNETAKNVGASFGKSANEVAKMQIELGKMGFTAEEINNATEAILALSVATGEDLVTSAETVSAVLKQYGLSSVETMRVTDVMTQAFNKSALGLNDFANSIKYVGPVAKTAGFTFEQTAAMLGTLADQGIKGEQAGTSLRFILTELALKGGDATKSFKEMLDRSKSVSGSFDEVGRNALTALNVLANNQEKLSDFTKAMDEAQGSTLKVATAMGDTLTGAWNRFATAFTNASLVQGINDFLKGLLESLSLALEGTTELFNLDKSYSDYKDKKVKSLIDQFNKENKNSENKIESINKEIAKNKDLIKQKDEQIIKERELAKTDWTGKAEERAKNLTAEKNILINYNNALGGQRSEIRKIEEARKNETVAVENNTKKTKENAAERKKRDRAALAEAEAMIRMWEEAAKAEEEYEKWLMKNRDESIESSKALFQAQEEYLKLVLSAQELEVKATEEKYNDIIRLFEYGSEEEIRLEEEKAEALKKIDEKYQKERVDLKLKKDEEIYGSTADLLGSLSNLFKENSLEYQILASGEAIINTYLGATKALASLPPPASYIAAAATIVQGLASVGKINNVVLKRADGGMIYGAGTGNSDSIPAMLSNGEAVVNARSMSSDDNMVLSGTPKEIISYINSYKGYGRRFSDGFVPDFAGSKMTGIDNSNVSLNSMAKVIVDGINDKKVIQDIRGLNIAQTRYSTVTQRGKW